jgi:hypothetical protein
MQAGGKMMRRSGRCLLRLAAKGGSIGDFQASANWSD